MSVLVERTPGSAWIFSSTIPYATSHGSRDAHDQVPPAAEDRDPGDPADLGESLVEARGGSRLGRDVDVARSPG